MEHQLQVTTNAVDVPPPEGVRDMSQDDTPAARPPVGEDKLVSRVIVVKNGGTAVIGRIYEKAMITALRVFVTGVVGLVDAVTTSDHPQIQAYYRNDPIADDAQPDATKP